MRQKGNDVVFKNAGRKLLTKRKKRLLYKRMDNKVTKKRIALHFEYDWLKYLLVIILSAFVMYMIFMQINITRDFERLEVFFSCYYNNDSSLSNDYLDAIRAEGDDVIRDATISYQRPWASTTDSFSLPRDSLRTC